MLDILVPDFRVIAPELILIVTAFVIIFWELITRTARHGMSIFLGAAGTLVALAVTASLAQKTISTFGDALVLDPFASFFKMIFLVGLLLTIAISTRYMVDEGTKDHSEYYGLLILAVVGMMVLATGRELITIFLGLELMSMSLYVLAGLFKTDVRSNEAALKYFVLGSFATCFMLFGMSYIYGIAGTTHLRQIGRAIAENPALLADKGLILGMFTLLVGFAFKISAVPFHQWTPDVYEGAPTSVTAFMSAGPKAAAFAAMIRVLMEALPLMKTDWELLFTVVAVLTMTVGNLVALAQESVKRMLAYSSIAHVGYILIAFVASVGGHADRALSAILFYLLAYTFMNTGAFAILIFLRREGISGEKLDDFAGLSRRSPIGALAMLIFLFSLAGIPPTAGFAAKLSVFYAAVQGGYYALVVIGVINSAVAAYYYLRVVVVMYMQEPATEGGYAGTSPLLWAGIALALAGTIVLGVLPGGVLEAARLSVISLL
ncbi:MAG: NADH-quinone oxidoreductase subunit N [bacterium]|nr:MAG: NADH-quinone oxidoreductase subunit N [bacterium]